MVLYCLWSASNSKHIFSHSIGCVYCYLKRQRAPHRETTVMVMFIYTVNPFYYNTSIFVIDLKTGRQCTWIKNRCSLVDITLVRFKYLVDRWHCLPIKKTIVSEKIKWHFLLIAKSKFHCCCQCIRNGIAHGLTTLLKKKQYYPIGIQDNIITYH